MRWYHVRRELLRERNTTVRENSKAKGDGTCEPELIKKEKNRKIRHEGVALAGPAWWTCCT